MVLLTLSELGMRGGGGGLGRRWLIMAAATLKITHFLIFENAMKFQEFLEISLEKDDVVG